MPVTGSEVSIRLRIPLKLMVRGRDDPVAVEEDTSPSIIAHTAGMFSSDACITKSTDAAVM